MFPKVQVCLRACLNPGGVGRRPSGALEDTGVRGESYERRLSGARRNVGVERGSRMGVTNRQEAVVWPQNIEWDGRWIEAGNCAVARESIDKGRMTERVFLIHQGNLLLGTSRSR